MSVKYPTAHQCRYYKREFCLAEEVNNIRVFTKDWFYNAQFITSLYKRPLNKKKDEYAPKGCIVLISERFEGDKENGIYSGFIPDMVNCPCMPVMDVCILDMPIRELSKAEKCDLLDAEIKVVNKKLDKLKKLRSKAELENANR